MSSFSIGTLDGTRTFTNSVSSTYPTDIYTFKLTASGTFSSFLTGLNADANLRLLSSSNTVLKRSSATGKAPESIKDISLAAGSYKIQVDRVSGMTNYNLKLSSKANSTRVNQLSSATSGLYPDDSGTINIKTEYGAKGDGVTDDTQAIQKAIKDFVGFNGRRKIIYFPKGTYLVSKTLEWKDSTGGWNSYLSLLGESESGAVIKLKDNAIGFRDAAKPKAVIYTAAIDSTKGNRAHNNFFENLTIDTGVGNRGAIGIDYLANNRASIRDVTIKSGDGQGKVGLNMTRGWTGPALIDDVRIVGFDYGIRTIGPEYSITFKDITLENQKVAGIDNTWNVLSIDGLTSHNKVPAIRNNGISSRDARGLIVLVDGNLSGGSASNVAIESNAGKIYARNIQTSGYQAALKDGTTVIPGKVLAEYIARPTTSLFSSPQTSLNLPIKDAPTFHDRDFSHWANIRDYGATPNDATDDTKAIQAALDSGKTTIYLPTGTYYISSTLHVRGNVKKIAGMESTLRSKGSAFADAKHPTPLLRFESGSADAVILDQIIIDSSQAGSIGVEQATAKTLVIQDAAVAGAIASYRSTPGVGQLFLDDVVGSRWRFDHPQNIWARHLNAEGWGGYPGNQNIPKIRNNGANLWILGLKTEVPTPVIETIGGGKTELLGGLLYPTREVPKSVPAFINNESSVSLVYAVSAYGSSRNYTIQVKETRGGVTKSLLKGDTPGRDVNGSVMPLYTGFR